MSRQSSAVSMHELRLPSSSSVTAYRSESALLPYFVGNLLILLHKDPASEQALSYLAVSKEQCFNLVFAYPASISRRACADGAFLHVQARIRGLAAKEAVCRQVSAQPPNVSGAPAKQHGSVPQQAALHPSRIGKCISASHYSSIASAHQSHDLMHSTASWTLPTCTYCCG